MYRFKYCRYVGGFRYACLFVSSKCSKITLCSNVFDVLIKLHRYHQGSTSYVFCGLHASLQLRPAHDSPNIAFAIINAHLRCMNTKTTLCVLELRTFCQWVSTRAKPVHANGSQPYVLICRSGMGLPSRAPLRKGPFFADR